MKIIDKNHQSKRTVLRIIGPIILIIGILLVVKGTSSMFGPIDPFEQGMGTFGLNFIGMPLIFVGAVLSGAGYMGTVARYNAEEMTPIATDVMNNVVDGTQGSIRKISSAIRGDSQDKVCQNCETDNDADAIFCKSCGQTFKSVVCQDCGLENDTDARFCKSCGLELK